MNPTMPFIHSNGTSVDDLLNDNLEARTAIEVALNRIAKMEFNGRDYYPVEGAWEKAKAERQAHIQALRDASDYFYAIAIHCSNIQTERISRGSNR